MSDNLREYDVVLGGQSAAPINAAVLGGIEAVKLQLSCQLLEHRISALSDALNYDEDGLKLVLYALNDSEEEIHKSAYKLLKNREEPDVKAALEKCTQHSYFIRFDGLYYTQAEYSAKFKANIYYYFRFYQDGVFLTVTISSSDLNLTEQDVTEEVAKWFNRHKKVRDINKLCLGTYTIDGKNIKLSFTSPTADYRGEIEMYGYTISVNTYSHTTLSINLLKYYFVHIPNIQ